MPNTMEIKLNHVKNLQFEGYSSSNPDYKIILDTSKEVGGNNEGIKPTELLLISLAGCSSMDIISILNKKKQIIESYDVIVKGQRSESHPMVFIKINIIYNFKGVNIDEGAVKRAISLSKDKYCSVWAMLQKAADIEFSYNIA
ncbi:MAG: OsmC family protein [bacterium]